MFGSEKVLYQGKIQGTNYKGQREPNSQFLRRSSLISADFRFSWELQHFGGANFRTKLQEPQIVTENRRKPQISAETRLSHLVCPFNSALLYSVDGQGVCNTRKEPLVLARPARPASGDYLVASTGCSPPPLYSRGADKKEKGQSQRQHG